MTYQANLKLASIIVGLFLSIFSGHAQECTLDIGGENNNTIIDIFQLNGEQQAAMTSLRTELKTTQKNIDDKIEKLFSTQPQSTEAELTTLSNKYKVLKDKMIRVSWESDKKLLETFNAKQYERYINLCEEALLDPISIVPISYKDSISPK